MLGPPFRERRAIGLRSVGHHRQQRVEERRFAVVVRLQRVTAPTLPRYLIVSRERCFPLFGEVLAIGVSKACPQQTGDTRLPNRALLCGMEVLCFETAALVRGPLSRGSSSTQIATCPRYRSRWQTLRRVGVLHRKTPPRPEVSDAFAGPHAMPLRGARGGLLGHPPTPLTSWVRSTGSSDWFNPSIAHQYCRSSS